MRYSVFVGVLLIGFACLTFAQPTTKPSPLETRLGAINFNGIALADAVEFLRDTSRTNIFVNWKSLERDGIDRNTQVTAKIDEDASLQQALTAVRDSLDEQQRKAFAFADDDGLVHIASKKDLDQRKPAKPIEPRGDQQAAAKTLAALQRPMPEVNFNQIAASDCLEFLKDISGLTFDVNWDELENAGVNRNTPVTLRLRNLPMARALRMVLDEISGGGVALDYVIDGDRIILSTREDLLKK